MYTDEDDQHKQKKRTQSRRHPRIPLHGRDDRSNRDYEPLDLHKLRHEANRRDADALRDTESRIERCSPETKEQSMTDLIAVIESEKWAIIPPNQETDEWTVFNRFDAEFGYQDEIGAGTTLKEAIEAAIATRKESIER
jgi:hypothetical protein